MKEWIAVLRAADTEQVEAAPKKSRGVGGPDEGFWLHIVLFEEAVDRSLEIEDRMEHAPFQSPFCERGEEPLDGV